MKVISISTDRNIFKATSPVRERQIEYGKLFEELHIVIFSKKLPASGDYGGQGNKSDNKMSVQEGKQIAPNVWIYSTNSQSRFSYIKDAKNIIKNIINERGFRATDTVISTQDPFETGLVGLKIKRELGLPLHVQIHTDFLSHYFARGFSVVAILNRIRQGIARKVLPNADAVRVVSRRILNSIEAAGIQLKKEPAVIPIFVDIQKIENSPVRVNLHDKYLHFNFIILMATRFTAEKNIPLALEVLKKILKAYPFAGLVIVGDGPEKNRLVGIARKLDMEKHVAFEPWQEDIVSYYKSANLFLSTSFYEGYGLSIVEAVASHCPTIATDTGIANDILHDGSESFVCPQGDVDCLWNKIRLIIEKAELRERYVHEAYNRLEKVVIIDKNEYLSLYKRSIESAKNGSN